SIAFHTYNISYLMWDWALADIGQTYMSALHFLEGQIPYKDFDYQWGPYSIYLSAWIFKILGIKISSVRLAMTLVVILITSLTYVLGRQFLPAFHALFGAFIVHLIFIRNTAIPYANVFVIAVGLSSLLLTVLYSRTRRKYLVLLAGLLCGVSLGLKLNAGLFIVAGIISGLLLVDGHREKADAGASTKSVSTYIRLLILIFLILNSIILLRAHLNLKYFLLFLAPIIFACFAALRLQEPPKGIGSRFAVYSLRLKRKDGSCAPIESPGPSEGKKDVFGSAFLYLVAGIALGSAPWLAFYLTKLETSKFFYYLIGSALEHSEHIFHSYYQMEKMTIYVLLYSAICWLVIWFMKKKTSGKHLWIMLLLTTVGYFRLFYRYRRPSKWFSFDPAANDLVGAVHNTMHFLPPLVCLVATLVILLNSTSEKEQSDGVKDRRRLLIVVLYQVFFFLVAYPHTESTHLGWSFPTTVILLLYLLERVRQFTISNWPSSTKNTVGRAVAAALSFFFPVLMVFSLSFLLMDRYCMWSPNPMRWSKRGFMMLGSERAGIYEPVASANQIEFVDEFIQTHTEKGEHIFEFPTTFFYFYSQRRNPSRCEYFYPGFYSDRQTEIIEAVEKAKPRFAITYDSPYAYVFSYSSPDIQRSFKQLIAYIESNYAQEGKFGYFTILRRKE
ncbi:MAG: hypothetical protein HY801_11340, partial [Candidatus Lindowbacteria bacterium]|nr:hypothetical protein [Candidatus Lindowbacteria bacterium]